MATLQDSLEYTPVELGFGTSGLRGLVTDMTDLECYINTAGFIRFLEATQKLQLGTDIYLAGDLRDSTPRILRAVVAAIRDKGYTPVHFGFIPTPAIAYHALQNDVPSIMVTGSHTPADRNGIKFYKVGGEVLKADEQAIKDAVAVERATIMHVAFRESAFDDQGQLKRSIALPAINNQAEAVYIQRHLNLFSPTLLTGKKVVVYQHSAVGRDMLGEVLQGLGAEVITVGRSDEFVPIDTENVTLDDRIYFALLAKENPGVFAIVSTDGDSDRPFVVDERGVFHRGDELGAVVAKWLAAAINWPIPLEKAILSDKDKALPRLADVTPVKPKRILVTGAHGQLGRALQKEFPDAEYVDREELDITSPDSLNNYRWKDYGTIINAAAYTAVDQSETPEGRRSAWKVNAAAVQNLAQIATENDITLVHVSTDYVFDGTTEIHDEDEDFAPLNIYGQSKAAGDIAAATVPKHYITRTTWVVGGGKNFIEVMKSLAEKGVKPTVVGDQIGRLTFTEDLAKAIRHLLNVKAPYGIYNVTNDGEPTNWAEIAQKTYELTGHDPNDVTPVTTDEYYAGQIAEGKVIAPRPLQSMLNIAKIQSTGFAPRRWDEALQEYIKKSAA